MKIKGGIASKNEAVVDSQGRLAVDVSGLTPAGNSLPQYISIAHNQAGDNLTVTTSNQNYAWTQVNFASTPALMTLDASDELTVVTGGIYMVDWHIIVGSSGATVHPFWVTVFQEIDEGGGGSWSPITGTLTANSIEFDPGGGQTKITLSGHVVTSFAATDKIRLRIRRGAGAAVTVATDGGNGSTWSFTRIAAAA